MDRAHNKKPAVDAAAASPHGDFPVFGAEKS
jgi:hypothetical protein